jgi:hypothetical protein
VSRIEHACRITGVNRPEHLIASHCKPWRDCESHDERLDGENGLLLTPTVDHLFDRGFISFENDGVGGEGEAIGAVRTSNHHECGCFSKSSKAYRA